MSTIKLAVIGVGKIARDQHRPALAANSDYELVATASPHHRLEGVPHYPDLETLLRSVPEVAAVAICTPPQIRHRIARAALEQGRHVLLEKPPGATLSEVADLVELARARKLALFATWHSREAAGVEPARRWLEGRTIRSIAITWKEDVRVWHPGQRWIFDAGGLGVFDPGINALSILTRIVPKAIVVEAAQLEFPANREAPIAAQLQLRTVCGAGVQADFDFRQTGPQTWDMEVVTNSGTLLLQKGGSVLRIDAGTPTEAPDREYHNLYAHFAQLVRARAIDCDVRPLQLVADAFLRGRRVNVDPFVD